MRTAVISDVHGNLEALSAVLERIAALKADDLTCLGDMVGYSANPNEVLDILRSMKATCILGNHDACASGLEEPEHFNPLARAAVLWTREQLTKQNRRFLMRLPRERQVRDFFIFHGSIHDTDRYLLYREDAVDNFRLLAGLPDAPTLGFFGHSHLVTTLIEHQGVISALPATDRLTFSPARRYLINPGSVGQPRDGDPRAAFLIYDDRDHTIAFHRVEYDFRTSQEKILRSGLPPRLAERLAFGQ